MPTAGPIASKKDGTNRAGTDNEYHHERLRPLGPRLQTDEFVGVHAEESQSRVRKGANHRTVLTPATRDSAASVGRDTPVKLPYGHERSVRRNRDRTDMALESIPRDFGAGQR